MLIVRALFSVAVFCLSIVAASIPASARDIINAPFDAVSIDILKVTEQVQSTSRDTDVETAPGSNDARPGIMRLSARSRGPIHRWLVFSIRNSSPIPLDYVIVSQRRSFVGSGIFWPSFGVRQIINGQASPGLPPTVESSQTADAYSFRLEANQTITYALEVAGPWPDNLNLWQRNAFDQRSQQVSFYHGLLLGVAALVAIYISSLFIIRRKVMFPAAALFAWSGTAFLAIEFGYLTALADIPVGVEFKIRAVVEALMVFALFVALYTFVELRKRMPIVGYATLAAIALCAVLIGFAYQEPAKAAGLSRIAMLWAGLGGLVIVALLSRRGVIRAQVALSSWLLIGLWSFLAFLSALGVISHDMTGPGLAAGLVLVNLMVAFTVTQYAFDAGVISSRFFEDSGRRALALAGSEQCVWDWREDQGWLYIGPELERTLGLPGGTLTNTGLKGWLELMHPGDRPAYVAAVEAAIQRGRGTFAQEFRLRRKDGTYRWFQLRARALPGEQGRAGRCIGTLADITTTKRSEERMLYDAVQDRLTGLPNRALFMDRLERSIRRSQADDRFKLFVAVIDIDRFKNVNDGLGHSVGDSLLLTMARRLQKFVGPEDTLARLAGDQFGMIISVGRPDRGVRDLAEQIRQAIAHPVELDPREVFLTASIGVCEYMRDITQPADVLKDAEIALYEAKRRGKNAIEFFRPTMRDDRSKLIEIESDLRRAIERNEIEVVYQPIYNIETDKLSGFEALVRWRHKKHGLLGPDEFIGIAEETGIIVELGHYVMSEAARQLGIWQRVARPTDPIFVSVNLSGRQVLDQNLVDDVQTIVSREDVAPGTFKLELTESLVMENAELSAQVLQRLNDLGVAILCDDFGTGYSSLSNLQRFPFDTLKIDRSFIHADPEDDAAMVILESIIILAHDLEMQVVAEGIENKEQLERLREFECDFAQGFYFGEPLAARGVIDALGGKPPAAEVKRAKSGRGLLGRLMRTGVAVPDAEQVEPDFDVPPRPSRAPRPPVVPIEAEAQAAAEDEEGGRPVDQMLRERAAERVASTAAKLEPAEPLVADGRDQPSSAAPREHPPAQAPVPRREAAQAGTPEPRMPRPEAPKPERPVAAAAPAELRPPQAKQQPAPPVAAAAAPKESSAPPAKPKEAASARPSPAASPVMPRPKAPPPPPKAIPLAAEPQAGPPAEEAAPPSQAAPAAQPAQPQAAPPRQAPPPQEAPAAQAPEPPARSEPAKAQPAPAAEAVTQAEPKKTEPAEPTLSAAPPKDTDQILPGDEPAEDSVVQMARQLASVLSPNAKPPEPDPKPAPRVNAANGSASARPNPAPQETRPAPSALSEPEHPQTGAPGNGNGAPRGRSSDAIEEERLAKVVAAAERKAQEKAAGKKPSKLAKLLRRGRKSSASAER